MGSLSEEIMSGGHHLGKSRLESLLGVDAGLKFFMFL